MIATVSPVVGDIGANGWEKYDFTVTAPGTTGTIGFREFAAENNGLGALIDNVALRPLDPTIRTNEDEGTALSFTVSDIDAGVAPLVATLTVQHATLSLTNTAGFTVTGGGTATLTVAGSQAAINAAVANGLFRYTPVADFNGADTLVLTVSDQGATGAGGALTATRTVPIVVAPAPAAAPPAAPPAAPAAEPAAAPAAEPAAAPAAAAPAAESAPASPAPADDGDAGIEVAVVSHSDSEIAPVAFQYGLMDSDPLVEIAASTATGEASGTGVDAPASSGSTIDVEIDDLLTHAGDESVIVADGVLFYDEPDIFALMSSSTVDHLVWPGLNGADRDGDEEKRAMAKLRPPWRGF